MLRISILFFLPLLIRGETVSIWAGTVVSTVLVTVTTAVPPAPPTTLATSFTKRCDEAYCSLGSRWCFYWGGITSYDVSRGPVPGETHTILGPCTNVTATHPATVVTHLVTGPSGIVATEVSTKPAFTTVEEQW